MQAIAKQKMRATMTPCKQQDQANKSKGLKTPTIDANIRPMGGY